MRCGSPYWIYTLNFHPGINIYNYLDKPDFGMNTLINSICEVLRKSNKICVRIPYSFELAIGKLFDLASLINGEKACY